MKNAASNYLKNLVEIRKITSKNHPEFGKYGVFAKVALDANIVLGEYTGKLECETLQHKVKLNRQNGRQAVMQAFFFDDMEFSVDVDAAQVGNEFWFLNDS